MRLVEELETLIDALDAAGVNYAVCGGLALAVHGHARATEDIDLLIREESLPTAIEASAAAGFIIETGWIRFRMDTPEEQKLYRLVKPTGREHLVLDLLIVTPIIEKSWESRQQFGQAERRLTALSVDGLIHMKKLSGRTRDLSDIERLQGTTNGTDAGPQSEQVD